MSEETENGDYTDDAISEFGELIRLNLKALNWNQSALAQISGVSNATISLIINNKYPNPSKKIVEKIRTAFDNEYKIQGKKSSSSPSDFENATTNDSTTPAVPGVGGFESFDPYNEETWPNSAGIYVFYDLTGRPVYVGKTDRSIVNRVAEHQEKFWFRPPTVEKGFFLKIEDAQLNDKIESILIAFLGDQALFNRNKLRKDTKDKRKTHRTKNKIVTDS